MRGGVGGGGSGSEDEGRQVGQLEGFFLMAKGPVYAAVAVGGAGRRLCAAVGRGVPLRTV